MHINSSKLNKSIGQKINLAGFVHNKRDHGGLIFIDLRSQSDLMQCVISFENNTDLFATVEELKAEYVIKVSGTIRKRSQETANLDLPTGEIELVIETIDIVSKAKTLPFDVHGDNGLANEDIRLKYRYLDLRREKLKNLLTLKHKFILSVRNWFDTEDFIEVQTPILANSSPEGARDFLVPSRLHPGHFYALPQAPQQFKQLLMVGGFNKYFQIAPCFRDEDPRSDRHPGDFYQIDSEIAWADEDYIYSLCVRLIQEVFINFTDKKLSPNPLIKISHSDAMNKYGSDKPDLRYDLAWQDVKKYFINTDFKVFADLSENEESRVQALVLKNSVNKFSRSDLDKIQDIGREFGLPGIAYIQYFEEETKSPIFKFLNQENIDKLNNELVLVSGDLVLFLAHQNKEIIWKAQNKIRQHIAKKLHIIDDTILQFVWINEFPFFEQDEKSGKVDFAHNPFSLWQGGLEALKEADTPEKLLQIRARQYDIACNGYEVLSGGVRNPNPEALIEGFKTVGYTEKEVRAKFHHMLEAYSFGAPSHAGFAWGLDRLIMILQEEDNIREVIAFPKNGSAIDPMVDSPSKVSDRQLKDLSIKLLD